MTKKATLERVSYRVIGLLLEATARNPTPVDTAPLRGIQGYGFNDFGLQGLATRLTAISQDYGGAAIGPSAVPGCNTPADVAQLVFSAIPAGRKE